jgi:hypothetical protein
MYQAQIIPDSFYHDACEEPCLCCTSYAFEDILLQYCNKIMNEYNSDLAPEHHKTDIKYFMHDAHDEIYNAGLAPVCQDCRKYYTIY